MLNRETESVAIEERIDGPIAVLQFCRPAQRNPLSTTTLDTFANILEDYKTSESVRVIIITGSQDVFLSGADIDELSKLDTEQAKLFSERGQRVTQALAEIAAVTIAAINGYCMGGGLDIALACDIRIASTSATFAHPGARLGVITGWGGTQRLPRLIGRTRALELFITARRFDSSEALEAGLITQIADPVLEAAVELATKMSSTS